MNDECPNCDLLDQQLATLRALLRSQTDNVIATERLADLLAAERDALKAAVERVRVLCDEHTADGWNRVEIALVRAALADPQPAACSSHVGMIGPCLTCGWIALDNDGPAGPLPAAECTVAEHMDAATSAVPCKCQQPEWRCVDETCASKAEHQLGDANCWGSK